MSAEDELLIKDLSAGGGKTIKHVTLNAPKSLNSLTLSMAQTLQPQLVAWEADDDVVCVFIEGAGDKAFCAGGDIVSLYRGMTGEGDPGYPDAFFENEYRLDYTLHTMTTPVLVWGDGIVMGGGIGIFAAGSHRVSTENSRLAMPEITIGLFPDVGGTWFLSRMPGSTGLFLGLTGSHINAGDALFTGLSDRFLPADEHEAVLNGLTTTTDWSNPHQAVSHVLRERAHANSTQPPESNVRKHLDRINAVTDADTLSEVVNNICALADDEDKWLSKAGKALSGGCPMTTHLVKAQIHQGMHLSLREVFQRELKMARQCARHTDFREGVRALLIDKDGQPDWRYKTVAEVPQEAVAAHFEPSWEGEHPLADLPADPA